MLSLCEPPPKTEIIVGYVAQAMYTVTSEGRLEPYVPDDPDFDLRFRNWCYNGFASRRAGAEQIHQNQLDAGFQSRILPGVVELVPGKPPAFFTVH